MDKFKNIKSIPAYISLMNIDTDKIIPKQFLKTIKRSGLGKNLFYEMRFDEKGKPIKPTFKYERNNKTRPPTQLLIVDDCLQSDSLLKSNGKHTISSIMLSVFGSVPT